jgi:hypothetical protein
MTRCSDDPVNRFFDVPRVTHSPVSVIDSFRSGDEPNCCAGTPPAGPKALRPFDSPNALRPYTFTARNPDESGRGRTSDPTSGQFV